MISISQPKHALEAEDQTHAVSFLSEAAREISERERRGAVRRGSVGKTKSIKRAHRQKKLYLKK